MRVLTLGAAAFPLRDELPKGGRFLVLSKRMQSASPDKQMSALYDFITMWLASTTGEGPDGPVEFDDALSEMEIDEIQKSVAVAVRQFSKRPTRRSSASADGSQSTTGTSKVVSFGKGTVSTEAESQTA